MAIKALRYTTDALIKCAYCGRVSHHIYKIPFGEFTYNLCSGQCVENARQNYEKNKDIKFTDSVELSPDYTGEDMD